MPFTQMIDETQPANTLVEQKVSSISFSEPIYVNPGEFVALVKKNIGGVATSGVIGHVVTLDYSWE